MQILITIIIYHLSVAFDSITPDNHPLHIFAVIVYTIYVILNPKHNKPFYGKYFYNF
jgi:hypothetical protein